MPLGESARRRSHGIRDDRRQGSLQNSHTGGLVISPCQRFEASDEQIQSSLPSYRVNQHLTIMLQGVLVDNDIGLLVHLVSDYPNARSFKGKNTTAKGPTPPGHARQVSCWSTYCRASYSVYRCWIWISISGLSNHSDSPPKWALMVEHRGRLVLPFFPSSSGPTDHWAYP